MHRAGGADGDPHLRAWIDFWTAAVLPDGRRRRVGALGPDIDEWLEATAAGADVARELSSARGRSARASPVPSQKT